MAIQQKNYELKTVVFRERTNYFLPLGSLGSNDFS